ncbi:MAG TPA: hypothetical protein PLV21_01255 [Cyclobacteriaceae bacterium]|nr:hypothetical protein [Cyclobacteriaceae bacterium]HRJ80482.1 hypothetical protein [Cyclobacteriaceae bacterium]
MALFNPLQVKEINEIIASVTKAIKPKCEIGANDKTLLNALLKTHDPKKKATYFKCKREYSETIVSHFVKDKGVTKSRFHKNSQAYIFIVT